MLDDESLSCTNLRKKDAVIRQERIPFYVKSGRLAVISRTKITIESIRSKSAKTTSLFFISPLKKERKQLIIRKIYLLLYFLFSTYSLFLP